MNNEPGIPTMFPGFALISLKDGRINDQFKTKLRREFWNTVNAF